MASASLVDRREYRKVSDCPRGVDGRTSGVPNPWRPNWFMLQSSGVASVQKESRAPGVNAYRDDKPKHFLRRTDTDLDVGRLLFVPFLACSSK